jgi:hypothetical protein
MLLHEKEFGDGIFHGQWRFKKVAGKQIGYNSGLYVRTALDGQRWFQVQVAHLDKRPFVADLFYDQEKNGKLERVIVEGTGTDHVKGPGEWNTFEITTQGKTGSVWLNGHIVNKWSDFPARRGHVGMQAEFFVLEFRALKFKELK